MRLAPKMMIPGEANNASTLLRPRRPLSSQSDQDTGTPSGRTPQKNLLKNDAKHVVSKGVHPESSSHFFSHGLIRLQHFSSDSPVRFLVYSEDGETLLGLHSDNTVSQYGARGYGKIISARLPFLGLTATKICGCVVGWGPGAAFTLLNSDLQQLDAARNGLDIRVCEAAEHSTELVTAGAGNVCVWSVMLMRCKLKIRDGLRRSTFSHLALAPPRADRHHTAFVSCGEAVTVVDLDDGKVLTHWSEISGGITAMVYCFQLDCVIIASQDLCMTLWSPELEPRGAFSGIKGIVNSLFYCTELNMLMSSSEDSTICCWDVKKRDLIACVHTDRETPPRYIGATRRGDTFFSFSHGGVDIWTFRSLYLPHCPLSEDKGSKLRQIAISPLPLPYPARVLCVSGDSDVSIVTAETGAVLTSFRAESRIVCADYCLHKEILLALTEKGTVLQANTLTNPITLMQEWKGVGQGPWHGRDCLIENAEIPGPACCLVVYRNVTDTKGALNEWRHLQARRRCSHRNKAAFSDAKNKFLIILGHSGGYLSVLKVESGEVLCRRAAHIGQKVTGLKVYPEKSYLLSAGEDLSVAVWKVRPFIDECLMLLLSLPCAQPQVYFAVLGSQLAFTFEDPNNYSYVLKHYSLLRHNQTDFHTRKGHLDLFTGLCVVPELKVFVSSSLDKTLRIWNEKNQLIRTLYLNTIPECLEYSGFGGELFLGVKGNLCKINCANFLPRSYQQMIPHATCPLLPPDSPVVNQRKYSTACPDGQGDSQAGKQPSTDVCQSKERLMTSSMDLEALVQDAVQCKKRKPPSTKETRKEAFQRYMKIVYGLTPNPEIDLEDILEPNIFRYHSKPKSSKPITTPNLKVDASCLTESSNPQTVEQKKKSTPSTPNALEPVEKVALQENQPELAEKNVPAIPITTEPVVTEDEASGETCITGQAKVPSPALCRTSTPATPREPSPEVPRFLKQFTGMQLFMDMYPDEKSISSTISPEDYSLQLLTDMQTCSVPSKMTILSALQALHGQGLLQNAKELHQELIDCVKTFVRPHMSNADRTTLVKMLTLLVSLKPPSCELIKLLLTLLANKSLGLRETLLHMLREFGVVEAEEWLWPELESWEEELQHQSDTWTDLQARADCWLELWISKYKEHNRYLYLSSIAKGKPLTVNMVDVLNHFCSRQKEEPKNTRHAAPARPNNSVLMPLYDCSYKPILRLGETYTMARIRKPGLKLPPVRNRPLLVRFPPLIPFPLSCITLNPSDEDWLKASSQRYFNHQEPMLECYRSGPGQNSLQQ